MYVKIPTTGNWSGWFLLANLYQYKPSVVYNSKYYLQQKLANLLDQNIWPQQKGSLIIKGALYSYRKSWLNTVCFNYYNHLIYMWLNCLCILAPENLVSMAKNKFVLLFYTLLLKLKLVSHFLSNRHEIFTQATLIILLKKSGFQFLISSLGAELCGIKLWDFVPQRTHST